MNSKAYKEQGIDLKRLLLVIGNKFWLVLLDVILGAVLGALIYKGVTSYTNGTPEYRISSDYYITFNFDEFEHGDDYYNAYTWDGILRDNPLVDYALTKLPEEITKDMVKDAVTGEMLGDYRILTVHVTTPEEERTKLIAKAYEESLVHFGEELELFKKIELWSQEELQPLEKNNKTENAALLGAILSGTGSLFLLLFYYVLEDSFYTEKDLRERFGLPVYGIRTRKQDPVEEQHLQENLKQLFSDEVVIREADQMPKSQDWKELKEKRLLLNVRFGEDRGRKIERVIEELKLHGCEPEGFILSNVKDSFLRKYYGKAISMRREVSRK